MSTGVHEIRLRGAWEVARDGSSLRYTRTFGRPRTVDPTESVWLVCQRVPGPAEVSLNGKPLGRADAAASRFACEITVLLQPRNSVSFQVNSDEMLGEVSIEIRTVSQTE